MQLAFSHTLRIAINYISNVSSREQVLALTIVVSHSPDQAGHEFFFLVNLLIILIELYLGDLHRV